MREELIERDCKLLPFDDSLLEANVPVLTHKIHRTPHEDGPTNVIYIYISTLDAKKQTRRTCGAVSPDLSLQVHGRVFDLSFKTLHAFFSDRRKGSITSESRVDVTCDSLGDVT